MMTEPETAAPADWDTAVEGAAGSVFETPVGDPAIPGPLDADAGFGINNVPAPEVIGAELEVDAVAEPEPATASPPALGVEVVGVVPV
jgi:hypothetical protein